MGVAFLEAMGKFDPRGGQEVFWPLERCYARASSINIE